MEGVKETESKGEQIDERRMERYMLQLNLLQQCLDCRHAHKN